LMGDRTSCFALARRSGEGESRQRQDKNTGRRSILSFWAQTPILVLLPQNVETNLAVRIHLWPNGVSQGGLGYSSREKERSRVNESVAMAFSV
jgi:hypothetical protein